MFNSFAWTIHPHQYPLTTAAFANKKLYSGGHFSGLIVIRLIDFIANLFMIFFMIHPVVLSSASPRNMKHHSPSCHLSRMSRPRIALFKGPRREIASPSDSCLSPAPHSTSPSTQVFVFARWCVAMRLCDAGWWCIQFGCLRCHNQTLTRFVLFTFGACSNIQHFELNYTQKASDSTGIPSYYGFQNEKRIVFPYLFRLIQFSNDIKVWVPPLRPFAQHHSMLSF